MQRDKTLNALQKHILRLAAFFYLKPKLLMVQGMFAIQPKVGKIFSEGPNFAIFRDFDLIFWHKNQLAILRSNMQ